MKYTLQIQFPFQQNKVVYALETFDPLVVRCGIPHFLLCKYISSNTNVKVLLSGNLLGKRYFPENVFSFRRGCRWIVRLICLYAKGPICPISSAGNSSSTFPPPPIRCSSLWSVNLLPLGNFQIHLLFSCTSCHGLEIRVPFLDKKFVSFVSRLSPRSFSNDSLQNYSLFQL